MLPLIVFVASLAAPARADAETDMVRLIGRWTLVAAECRGGSAPDPRFFPEKGDVFLTVMGESDFANIQNAVLSRWDAKNLCWSVGPAVLFQGQDDETAFFYEMFPGFQVIADNFVPLPWFEIGLACPKNKDHADGLLNSTHTFYPRFSQETGRLRFVEFNSRLCSPQQDISLSFERLDVSKGH